MASTPGFGPGGRGSSPCPPVSGPGIRRAARVRLRPLRSAADAHSDSPPPPSPPCSLPATDARRRRSRHAARRGPRRDAVHRLLGRARDGGRAVRRRGDRRVDDRATGARAADPGPGSGPAVDETGIGPGLLRLADLLPGRARARRATSARSRSRSASTAARSCWRRRSRRSSATRSTRRARARRRARGLAPRAGRSPRR